MPGAFTKAHVRVSDSLHVPHLVRPVLLRLSTNTSIWTWPLGHTISIKLFIYSPLTTARVDSRAGLPLRKRLLRHLWVRRRHGRRRSGHPGHVSTAGGHHH